MGCNCGGKRATTTLASGRVSFRRPRADKHGLYQLASHPDCTTPYTGAFRSASIYVVGLGTDQERLFVRAEAQDAVAYARATGQPIAHLPAAQFCQDAMVAFLGA